MRLAAQIDVYFYLEVNTKPVANDTLPLGSRKIPGPETANRKPRMNAKPRLTTAQRQALKAYKFAEQQEDRYMGSVFANASGQRQHEAKTRAAYEACKRLGMGIEQGL